MIPLLVVVAENLVWEVVNNLHYTDRQTVTVLAAWIELWESALVHAHHSRAACTPLLMDNATLLVNLLAVEDKGI